MFRPHSFRSGLARPSLAALTLVLLPLVMGGCDQGGPGEPMTVIMNGPDGSARGNLFIPAGATYYYQYGEFDPANAIVSIFPPDFPLGDTHLVIARIDWSFCNPGATKIRFRDNLAIPQTVQQWRVPSVSSVRQAGISILGFFSGGQSGTPGTLEGGLTMPLNTGGQQGGRVALFSAEGACQGDWVALYGYSQ